MTSDPWPHQDLNESWSSTDLRASLNGCYGNNMHNGGLGNDTMVANDTKPVIPAANLAGYSGMFKGIYSIFILFPPTLSLNSFISKLFNDRW
jgi:hypothetical protein